MFSGENFQEIALEIAREIEGSKYEIEALSVIANAYDSLSDSEQVQPALAQVLSVVESSKDSQPKIWVLDNPPSMGRVDSLSREMNGVPCRDGAQRSRDISVYAVELRFLVALRSMTPNGVVMRRRSLSARHTEWHK